jgi:hypothetical protein
VRLADIPAILLNSSIVDLYERQDCHLLMRIQ